jgi:hypothetical protein
MIIYLQSIDYDLLLSIENDITVPKARNEYVDGDKKLLSMDAKAMNTLYCALNRSKFNRITSCKKARNIWHVLRITHEGTNQVKE